MKPAGFSTRNWIMAKIVSRHSAMLKASFMSLFGPNETGLYEQ